MKDLREVEIKEKHQLIEIRGKGSLLSVECLGINITLCLKENALRKLKSEALKKKICLIPIVVL